MQNRSLRKDSSEGFPGRIPEGSAEGSAEGCKKELLFYRPVSAEGFSRKDPWKDLPEGSMEGLCGRIFEGEQARKDSGRIPEGSGRIE